MSDEEAVETPDTMAQVLRYRREEALRAGMSWEDADLWACGLHDIRELRRLVELKCPPGLLGRILN